MTMTASGSHGFQVMCSGPRTTVCPRLKDATMTPALVSRRESARDPNSSNAVKELALKDAVHPAPESNTTSFAFVYGTLKRGFGNHWLMEEEMRSKHCHFVGTARTKDRYPLVCGPFQVPFLLDVVGSGEHVLGELYQVNSHCLALLDELEGTSKGHYVRCPVILTGLQLDPSYRSSLENGLDELSLSQQQLGQNTCSSKEGEIQAEAYFAAMHFTPGLYKAPHIEAYTEKESATYTRRIHRPQHRTFVEHVYHWIDEELHTSSPLMV